MLKILAIVPSAGHPTNTIHASYNSLPDCMIPINSKPVIGHIIDDLIHRGIQDVLLLLNKNDIYTEKYLSIRYNKKINIIYSYIQDSTKGIIGSIKEGINDVVLSNYDSIFIYLGDTIYKGDLVFDNSFYTVKSEYNDSNLWCFIEKLDNKLKFINKPLSYEGKGSILTGLYFFRSSDYFEKSIINLEKGELYNLLDNYQKSEKVNLIDSDKWYDLGNIDNYYKAKIDFLKVRSFNNVMYNDVYGTIIKSSTNNQKINWEINWYLNIPYELKILAPRLVNYGYGDKSFYEIEYYGYQSLGDLFLFGFINENIWYSIINKLFDTIDLFKKYKTIQPFSFFYDMYYLKTMDRVKKMNENEYFNNLYKFKNILINGVEYKNLNTYINDLEKNISYLFKLEDITFIHGDFCLSNIMFDTGNKILKMIDPRGFFGEVGVYGDVKYDIAKLKHSLVGYYDFIVSDLFKINENGNSFIIDISNDKLHSNISTYFNKELVNRGYNIDLITYIEALLFLTMIPLHNDNLDRQKAMYLIAVQKFNSVNYNNLGKMK